MTNAAGSAVSNNEREPDHRSKQAAQQARALEHAPYDQVLEVPNVKVATFSANGQRFVTVRGLRCHNLFVHDGGGDSVRALGSKQTCYTDAWLAPSGRQLITLDFACTLHLWDLERGKSGTSTELLTHEKAEGIINVCFSADESTLAATAYPGGLLLWNLAEPKAPPTTLAAVASDLAHLRFSGDGRCLAVTGDVGETHLWDLASQPKVVRSILRTEERVHRLSASPDGRWLLTTTADSLMTHIWDLTQPQPAKLRVPQPEGRVCHALFSPDSRTFVMSMYKGDHLLYSAETLQFTALESNVPWSKSQYFHPHLPLLLAHHGNQVAAWSLARPQGYAVSALEGPPVSPAENAKFFADGRRIATWSNAVKPLRVWEQKNA